jgi:hypothetical protein
MKNPTPWPAFLMERVLPIYRNARRTYRAAAALYFAKARVGLQYALEQVPALATTVPHIYGTPAAMLAFATAATDDWNSARVCRMPQRGTMLRARQDFIRRQFTPVVPGGPIKTTMDGLRRAGFPNEARAALQARGL